MRIAKFSMCAAALSAAMLVGCSSSSAGGGSTTPQEDMSTGPTAGETAGNVAIQAAATESMKKGGGMGSVGYGLQQQGSNLSRALFGKKKTAPKPTDATASSASSSSSAAGTTPAK